MPDASADATVLREVPRIVPANPTRSPVTISGKAAGRSTSRCFARCEAKPECFFCSTRCFVANRTSCPSCITADCGCDITGNISCFVSGSSSGFNCYFACDGSSCFPGFVAAKGIGTARSAYWRCFAFSRSDRDRRRIVGCTAWDTDSSVIRSADRRRAMADSNCWRAADVFRGMAPCASLFAAQYQL